MGMRGRSEFKSKALTLTPAHAIPFEQKLAAWREIVRFLNPEL